MANALIVNAVSGAGEAPENAIPVLLYGVTSGGSGGAVNAEDILIGTDGSAAGSSAFSTDLVSYIAGLESRIEALEPEPL